MVKIIFVIMSIWANCFAVKALNYYWTVNLAGDNVSVTKLKRNYDSIRVAHNEVKDTINSVIPRWHWFTDHVKIFPWMNIDTIKGPVGIDTIKGLTHADNLYTTGRDTSIQTMIDDKVFKTALDDTILAHLTGTANYIQISTGSGTIGNSTILKNGSSYGFGTTYLNSTGAASTGLYFDGGNNRMLYRLGIDDNLVTQFYGADVTTEYFGVGIQNNQAILTAGSALTNNVAMVFRIALGGFESEAMRFTENKVLQTNGNYINNDGVASQGLYFDGSNNGVFTKIAKADSVASTKGVSGTIGRFTTSVISAIGTFTGRVTAKSFSTNGEDTLVCEDTTFYDSLYDGGTYRARAQFKLVRVGNSVTMILLGGSNLTGTITSATVTYLKGIPSKFLPATAQKVPVSIIQNTVYSIGFASVSSTNSAIFTEAYGFLNAGTCGLSSGTVLHWVID